MDADMVERLAEGEFVSRHEFSNRRAVDEMVELGFLEYDDDGLLQLGELSRVHLRTGEE